VIATGRQRMASVPQTVRRIGASPVIAGIAGVVALALLLELAIVAGFVPEFVVARPSEAIAAIGPLHRDMDLVSNFLLTFGMTLSAIGLAILVGVPLGYLLYRYEVLGVAYEGWLAALFAAPIVLLYPLFLVIIGRSHLTLVAMAFIPGVIPIIIQTRQGLLSTPPTLINVGRSFNISERFMFWQIMLPAAVPSIFTGMRIGVMYALVTVVAIEYLIDFGGLGRIVSEMYFRFDIPGTYASILFVVFVSILFYASLGWIEKWLRPA
jgi:ABC-type nitrate/sulfonate/bicarbonate transport system permease component